MNHFFDTVETIEDGVGFEHFGLCHILWLIFALFIFISCSVIYKNSDETKRIKMRHMIAILLLLDEAFKVVCLLIGGNYTPDYLPLHLCSINIILIAVHAHKPSKMLDSFLYTVCIPAAMAALLFPSWSDLPTQNFMHIHSFTVHIMLALYPIMLTVGGDIKPDIKETPKTLFFLLLLAGAIYIVNLLLDTNFMFLMYAGPGNPLYVFKQMFGSHLVGFVVLIPIIFIVMNFPWVIIKNKGS